MKEINPKLALKFQCYSDQTFTYGVAIKAKWLEINLIPKNNCETLLDFETYEQLKSIKVHYFDEKIYDNHE